MTLATKLTFYYEFSRLASHSSHPIDQKFFSTQEACSTRHVCQSVWLSVLLLTDIDVGIQTNKVTKCPQRVTLLNLSLCFCRTSLIRVCFQEKRWSCIICNMSVQFFTLHMLQVFSVCKQQIYSLSEYIPRERIECICCTYVVKWQDLQIACHRLLSYVHLNFIFGLSFYTTTTIVCSNYEDRSRRDITNVGRPSCKVCLFFILTIIDTCPQIL